MRVCWWTRFSLSAFRDVLVSAWIIFFTSKEMPGAKYVWVMPSPVRLDLVITLYAPLKKQGAGFQRHEYVVIEYSRRLDIHCRDDFYHIVNPCSWRVDCSTISVEEDIPWTIIIRYLYFITFQMYWQRSQWYRRQLFVAEFFAYPSRVRCWILKLFLLSILNSWPMR